MEFSQANVQEHVHRRQPGEMEVGVTDVVADHAVKHVVHAPPISRRRLQFEKSRPVWLREMMAEATGVFFYVYAGVSAQTAFYVTGQEPQYSSILAVAIAYALGIAFAIITSASTSGGHFNPAVTIGLAIFQGFPIRKVPRYIFAQILGAFIASAIIYGQFYQQLTAVGELTASKGIPAVSFAGPASAFVPLPQPTQGIGYVFLIEFFVDSFIGFVIASVVLDPANPFISPSVAPFALGLTYASMIIGFGTMTISTNLARDLGPRMFAAIIWGREVFTFENYSGISILVNIPATLMSFAYYHFVFLDSTSLISAGHATHPDNHIADSDKSAHSDEKV